MGLTLHYQLASTAITPAAARGLVEKLRHHAKTLHFSRVGELIELKGGECRLEKSRGKDAHAWLKIQATRFITRTEGDTTRTISEIHPTHLIAFTIKPGAESEHANFGLCRYPGKSKAWAWSSFCKTQYASNPAAGGVANFLKCHLGLIDLLDKAKELGILENVEDEGKYWKGRDAEALASEVGKWNQMIAGFYGMMRDGIEAAGGDPGALASNIAKFSDFERLEAKARSRKK
jgi:hypothetical protein